MKNKRFRKNISYLMMALMMLLNQFSGTIEVLFTDYKVHAADTIKKETHKYTMLTIGYIDCWRNSAGKWTWGTDALGNKVQAKENGTVKFAFKAPIPQNYKGKLTWAEGEFFSGSKSKWDKITDKSTVAYANLLDYTTRLKPNAVKSAKLTRIKNSEVGKGQYSYIDYDDDYIYFQVEVTLIANDEPVLHRESGLVKGIRYYIPFLLTFDYTTESVTTDLEIKMYPLSDSKIEIDNKYPVIGENENSKTITVTVKGELLDTQYGTSEQGDYYNREDIELWKIKLINTKTGEEFYAEKKPDGTNKTSKDFKVDLRRAEVVDGETVTFKSEVVSVLKDGKEITDTAMNSAMPSIKTPKDLPIEAVLKAPPMAEINQSFLVENESIIPSTETVKSNKLYKSVNGGSWSEVSGWNGKKIFQKGTEEGNVSFRIDIETESGKRDSDEKTVEIIDSTILEVYPSIDAPSVAYEDQWFDVGENCMIYCNGVQYTLEEALRERIIIGYKWDYSSIAKAEKRFTYKGGRLMCKLSSQEDAEVLIKLQLTDKKGHKHKTDTTVRIESCPVADLDVGFAKENRKVIIKNTSVAHVNYPIVKTDIRVEPNEARVSQADIKRKSNNEWLFKKAGSYKATITVTDSRGRTDSKTVYFTVIEDKKPTAKFNTANVVLRDPKDSNNASVIIVDASSSEDDHIGRRIYSYRYDSDNDGNFAEEKRVVVQDGNLKEATAKLKEVGKYEFEILAIEDFKEPTIPEFVTDSDYLRDDYKEIVEVINVAPSAMTEVKKKFKTDLQMFLGSTIKADLKDNLAYFEAKLRGADVDYNLSTQDISVSEKFKDVKIFKAERFGRDTSNSTMIASKNKIVTMLPAKEYGKLQISVLNRNYQIEKSFLISKEEYQKIHEDYSFIDHGRHRGVPHRFGIPKIEDYNFIDKDEKNMYIFLSKDYDYFNSGEDAESNKLLVMKVNLEEEKVEYVQRIDYKLDTILSGGFYQQHRYKNAYVINEEEYVSFRFLGTRDITRMNKKTGEISYQTFKNHGGEFLAHTKNYYYELKDSKVKAYKRSDESFAYEADARKPFSGSLRQSVHYERDILILTYWSSSYGGSIVNKAYFPTGKVKASEFKKPSYYEYFKYADKGIIITELSEERKMYDAISGELILDIDDAVQKEAVHQVKIEEDRIYFYETRYMHPLRYSYGAIYVFDRYEGRFIKDETAPDKRMKYTPGTIRGFDMYNEVQGQNNSYIFPEAGIYALKFLWSGTNYWSFGKLDPSVDIQIKNGIENKKDWRNGSKKYILPILNEPLPLVNINNLSEYLNKFKISTLFTVGENRVARVFANLLTSLTNGKINYFKSDTRATLEGLADKLINQKNEYEQDPKILLVGETIDSNMTYKDYENDPQYQGGEFKYVHEPSYFENGQGTSIHHNKTLTVPAASFDKVGRYFISAKVMDNPKSDNRFSAYRKSSSDSNRIEVKVHRRPIINSLKVTSQNASDKVSDAVFKKESMLKLEDDSVDLDRESTKDKGIRSFKLEVINLSDMSSQEFSNTLYFSLEKEGKYKAILTVFDEYGEASIPKSYDFEIASEESTVDLKPIAWFKTPPTVYVGEKIAVDYDYYDLDGTITNVSWTDKTNIDKNTIENSNYIYLQPGEKTINLSVTDNAGNRASATQTLRVLETKPKAVLMETGTPKENRKMSFNVFDSQKDYYDLDLSKTLWSITSVSGDAGAIRYKVSADGEIQALFKKKGKYKITATVKDTKGNSDTASLEVDITEDIAPTIEMDEEYYLKRRPDGKAYYEVNTLAKSLDEDFIEKIDYYLTFDANNNGFSDDTEISLSSLRNKTKGELTLDRGVGRYKLRVVTKEGFGQPTISEFVNSSDYKTATKECIIEVYNTPPRADFVTNKRVYLVGETIGYLNSKREKILSEADYSKMFIDTEGDEFLKAEWRFSQNASFMPKQDKTSSHHNKKTSTLIKSLDAAGEYTIGLKVWDKATNKSNFSSYNLASEEKTQKVIVHRAPLPELKVTPLRNTRYQGEYQFGKYYLDGTVVKVDNLSTDPDGFALKVSKLYVKEEGGSFKEINSGSQITLNKNTTLKVVAMDNYGETREKSVDVRVIDADVETSIVPKTVPASEAVKISIKTSKEFESIKAFIYYGESFVSQTPLTLEEETATYKKFSTIHITSEFRKDKGYKVLFVPKHRDGIELNRFDTFNISTPINLVPAMEKELYSALTSTIWADTSSYANSVKVKLYKGTKYETTLDMGKDSNRWKIDHNPSDIVPEGSYVAEFTATTPNGNVETKEVGYKVVTRLIINGTIEPNYPNPVPASEDFTVKANIRAGSKITSVKVILDGESPVEMDYAGQRRFDHKYDKTLTVPTTKRDKDYYNVEVFVTLLNGKTGSVNLKLKVLTPVNLKITKFDSELTAGETTIIKTRTSKYVNSMVGKLFVGTKDEQVITFKNPVRTGEELEWTYSYKVPEGIKEGNYNASFTATTTNRNTETATRTYKLNNLKIISATLMPQPALAGDKLYFTVETQGYADKIVIDVPKEMSDKDKVEGRFNREGRYQYPLTFKVNSKKNKKTDVLEYITSVKVDKTLTKDDQRLREPYKFVIRAYKGDIVKEAEVTLEVRRCVLDLIKVGVKK